MADFTEMSAAIEELTVCDTAKSLPAGQAYSAAVPVELLLQIFTDIEAKDVLSFLTTCRSYRALLKNESIWLELCSRYGVRDLPSSGFHKNTSYFTVYTELLHTYGPLLGLWASDNAFLGNILEFRLVPESKDVGWEGIIGEVWRFKKGPGLFHDEETLNIPVDPSYYEAIRIELLPPEAELVHPRRRTRFVCEGSTTDSPFYFNKPHRQAYYCLKRHLGPWSPTDAQAASLHPVFPLPHSPWVDDRPHPRLRTYPAYPISHQEDLDDLPRFITASCFYLLPAPADAVLPTQHSLSIIWSQTHALHNPMFDYRDINDLRTGHSFWGHYYPLRSPLPPPSAPQPDTWDPRTLTGLWLGAYSAHGTEVLYLVYDETTDGELRAWKITGDINVPRGVISWKARIHPQDYSGVVALPMTDELLISMGFLDVPAHTDVKMFEGLGTNSSAGFTSVSHYFVAYSIRSYNPNLHRENGRWHVPLVAAIVNQNEIRCRWNMHAGISYVPRYRRYLGRDVMSETMVSVNPRIREARRMVA